MAAIEQLRVQVKSKSDCEFELFLDLTGLQLIFSRLPCDLGPFRVLARQHQRDSVYLLAIKQTLLVCWTATVTGLCRAVLSCVELRLICWPKKKREKKQNRTEETPEKGAAHFEAYPTSEIAFKFLLKIIKISLLKACTLCTLADSIINSQFPVLKKKEKQINNKTKPHFVALTVANASLRFDSILIEFSLRVLKSMLWNC